MMQTAARDHRSVMTKLLVVNSAPESRFVQHVTAAVCGPGGAGMPSR